MDPREPFAGIGKPLRALVAVSPEGSATGRKLELWLHDRSCWFVRFLEREDRGKVLGESPQGAWWTTPSSRRPLAVGPGVRLAGGAGVPDLLGPGLSDHYRKVSERSVGRLVETELEAVEGSPAPYPRILWVAEAASGLPVRAEFRSGSGKALRGLEFRGWLDRSRRIPAEIAVADLLRASKLVVRFLAWEEISFDPAACRPEGASVRSQLPEPLRPPPQPPS